MMNLTLIILIQPHMVGLSSWYACLFRLFPGLSLPLEAQIDHIPSQHGPCRLLPFFKNILISVCVFVYVYVVAHGGQKRALDPWS